MASSPQNAWKTTLLRRPLVRQHAQHVGVRVPVVDHQRLAHPLGQIDVPAEVLLLLGRRRAVPVVVQPGLADGDDPGVACQPLELVVVVVGQPGDLGRVDRDRGPDVGVPLGGGDAPARGRDGVADRDRGGHTDTAGPGHDGGDERLVGGDAGPLGDRVQVGVRVEDR